MDQKTFEEIELEKSLFQTVETTETLPFSIDSAAFDEEEVIEDKEQPKWHDEHDDLVKVNLTDKSLKRKLRKEHEETTLTGTEYAKRLRAQFEKIHKKPEWAEVRSNEDDDSLDFLRSTFGIKSAAKQSSSLDPDFLEVFRMKDANVEDYSQATIQSCRFHPNANVVLTAGLDKTLRLFKVAPFSPSHPKIRSFHFSDMPIYSAQFSENGRFVVLTGRRKFFYVLDLNDESIERIPYVRGVDAKSLENVRVGADHIVFITGSGYLHIVSLESKQWIKAVKVNGYCIDARIIGKHLYVLGSDSVVYKWSLTDFSCLKTWRDEANVHPTALSVSPKEDFVIIGTQSGITSIYSLPDFKLLKTIENLTTSISDIVFHPSSQLVAISSRKRKDALRMVHLPSMRVFQNWPTANTPLSYVNQVSFSADGKFLAVGNEKGKVLLYGLKAFN